MTVLPSPHSPRSPRRPALGHSPVDRAGHRRSDTLIAELLERPTTRVLTLVGEQVLVDGRPAAPVLRAPQSSDLAGLGLFLGEYGGVEYVAVVDPAPDGSAEGVPAGADGAAVPGPDGSSVVQDGMRWVGLRQVGAVLNERDAGLVTVALGLAQWHRRHGFCPRCGALTRVTSAGWVRVCDLDGSEHYPRVDPAVIMAVVDDDQRLLLGRGATWPAGRFSTLAGFVEPGEEFEDAVRREVHEESGVLVDEVSYLGSQPWPFPASVMVGFSAHAASTKIQVDGIELGEARWFTRSEYRDAIRSGELRTPTRLSISRFLVEHWFGEDLGEDVADAPTP